MKDEDKWLKLKILGEKVLKNNIWMKNNILEEIFDAWGSKIGVETKKLYYFYYCAKFASNKFELDGLWAHVSILAITFLSEVQMRFSSLLRKAKR